MADPVVEKTAASVTEKAQPIESTELAGTPSETPASTEPTPAPESISTEPSSSDPVQTEAPSKKQIRSLVIDTGPLIKNEIAISSLIAQAEELYTIPSVLSEIRDAATRARVQTTLIPFLKLRNPKPDSIKFISDFARKTGDLQVLSRPDIALLALTYELELENNEGDWRLRKTPAQKGVNGKPPGKQEEQTPETAVSVDGVSAAAESQVTDVAETGDVDVAEPGPAEVEVTQQKDQESQDEIQEIQSGIQDIQVTSTIAESGTSQDVEVKEATDGDSDEDSDGGWITPSNIKRHQAKAAPAKPQATQRFLQAALLTSDIAMKNVALRINLNLLDTTMSRITHLKTWVLRCHGCMKICREMNKQFCPSCGQATLTRVSCSTSSDGTFQIHLKKNFQWNNRGNVYSIPKPTHGSASGKSSIVKGGGKNGWGKELILAEDQKEYVKKMEDDKRTRYRDLMDEDYLPSILSGDRRGGAGRIKVGAGRNVNSKKR